MISIKIKQKNVRTVRAFICEDEGGEVIITQKGGEGGEDDPDSIIIEYENVKKVIEALQFLIKSYDPTNYNNPF